MEAITPFVGLVALLVTVAIAIGTWRAATAAQISAQAAERTAEAQIVAQFLDDHASDKMREALARLRVYAEANPNVFPARGEDPTVHGYGRLVQDYFRKAHQLNKGGLLSDKALRLVADVEGYNLLFKLVVPLLAGDKEAAARVVWAQELEAKVPRLDEADAQA